VIVSRDKLIELAELETHDRVEEQGILSGYLIGSVATGNPVLGGTADIDLVLIHENQPAMRREIQRISENIHLDIYHYPKELYLRPRELRIDPWIGPSLSAPIFIHDPQHFFEWAQAGARGQFFRADHVLSRATEFYKRARQTSSLLALSNRWLKTYTRAVLEAANAVVTLVGNPAAGRRLMLDVERHTQEAGYPHIYYNFLQLLGGSFINATILPKWLSDWGYAFDAAAKLSNHPELNPCRRMYYLRGFQALAEVERPEAVLWTMLTTWERSTHTLTLSEKVAPYQAAWHSVLERLQLGSASTTSRMEELEDFMNTIDGLLAAWAEQVGV